MKLLPYRERLNSEPKLSKGNVIPLYSYFTVGTSLPRGKKKLCSEEPKKAQRKVKISVIVYTHQVFAPLLADSSPEAAEFFQSWLCSLFLAF